MAHSVRGKDPPHQNKVNYAELADITQESAEAMAIGYFHALSLSILQMFAYLYLVFHQVWPVIPQVLKLYTSHVQTAHYALFK